MTPYRLTKLSLAIGLSIATTSAIASPQAFMSSRSFAMGGTGVAVAHPAAAGATNPAMMAADHTACLNQKSWHCAESGASAVSLKQAIEHWCPAQPPGTRVEAATAV